MTINLSLNTDDGAVLEFEWGAFDHVDPDIQTEVNLLVTEMLADEVESHLSPFTCHALVRVTE